MVFFFKKIIFLPGFPLLSFSPPSFELRFCGDFCSPSRAELGLRNEGGEAVLFKVNWKANKQLFLCMGEGKNIRVSLNSSHKGTRIRKQAMNSVMSCVKKKFYENFFVP